MAHCHGRPWLPWQADAAALVSERLGADPMAEMAYPTVVALVPRQCGKTTWDLDLSIGRCVDPRIADYRAAYTAQTGQITTERITERLHEMAQTALATRYRALRSAGRERLTFGDSWLKAFPPKDGALRGFALDLVSCDEAQEIGELQGTALDQTILPTFTTRPRRQLIMVGTAGTAASVHFAKYVALARGGARGVAAIEYGATEDDDWTDPALWWRVHPGLAAGLTDEAALRAALLILGPEGFAREYLNVWQSTAARIVPASAWSACRRVRAVPAAGVPPVLAVDVAVDRSASAIVAVWPDVDGVPVAEVIDYAPGVDWPAARLIELRATHRPPVIVADSQGPVLTVVDELTRADVPVVQTDSREYQVACASTLDAIIAGRIGHRAQTALDAAVAGAAKRRIGDGWAWARRAVTVDVCPLVAASLAYWGNERRPAAPARPVVDTG